MNQEEQDVLLYQYDLTNGLAKTIVKFMTGKDMEAVWHTSIVVFGKEYFYGGGICSGQPKKTPYGLPIKESVFGKTTKTKEELSKFLKEISDDFNYENYHVFKHNCNHFTNEVCKFLCGKPLPDEILSQEKLLDGTEFGKWLLPKLEKMSEKIVPDVIEGKK